MVGYLRSVWAFRYFWLSLVGMDLRNRYRGSVLGIGWSFIQPAAMTAVFSVFYKLFGQSLAEFVPYLVCGLLTWNYVSGCALQGCQCFFAAEAYLRQYPTPTAIYPLRTVLGLMIQLLMGMVVALALTVALGGPPHVIGLLSLLPSMLLIGVAGWAVAALAGVANVVFQDTKHILEVGFQILFYASPVVYHEGVLTSHGLGWWLQLNPVVPFLALVRQPLLAGQPPSAVTVATATGLTLALVTGATWTLARVERKLVFFM